MNHVLQGLKFLKPIAKDNDVRRPCLQKKDILKLIHNLFENMIR